AFTLMENNVVEIDSQALADYYSEDFEQLWEKQNFENSCEIHTPAEPVGFAGQPAQVRVMFSPGCGLEIDSEIARHVRTAPRSDLQLADQFRHANRPTWQFDA